MPPPSTLSSSAANWEPISPEELQRLLPQYEVSEMIGIGGMGAVYKGRQANLDRVVAIKVLSDTIVQSDDEFNFVARFKQEARAMAKLDHPAIVSVIDFGETSEGHLYLVMEFIDGMDIHQFLEHHGGHLSQEHALSITAHVLDALGYAHSQGIVHRDIKPANILLKQDGRVKIADFGLAKTFGEDPGLTNYALTTTNATVGTPDYVAPEALEMGNQVDQRADLYAVGVMLYRMLTGKLPRESFKMPSEMFPELDPRLDEIVEKATESDPDYRYATAEDIRTDIDAVVSQPISRIEVETKSRVETKEAPRPEEKGTRKRTLYIGIGIVALSVIGGLAALFMPENSVETNPVTQEKLQTIPKVPGGSNLPVTAYVVSATKDKPYENSFGMRFVPVPITGGVYEGKTVMFSIWETRVKDYEAFLKHDSKRVWVKQTYAMEADHPAVMVSWDDAVAYCEWLTTEERKNGKIGSDEAYRLPTDHEWSCAVGIGDEEDAKASPSAKNGALGGIYPWGDSFPPKSSDGNYYGQETKDNPHAAQKAIKGFDDGFDRTAPVGSFKVNKYGIYDLGGNVWEWVQDWMDPDVKKNRLFRGASWGWPTELILRSSSRLNHPPDSKWGSTGFRVILERIPNLILNSSVATGIATKEEPYENSLGMRFVPIPITEGPSVGQRILFSVWESRVKDYQAFLDESEERPWPNANFDQEDDHPAVNVTWEDAVAFCAWLTDKERKSGLLGAKQMYRLPSDHEWSCAVGIGDSENSDHTPAAKKNRLTGFYPWGLNWPPPKGAGNFYGEECRQYPANDGNRKMLKDYDDGYERTAPVGTYGASKLGLFDMSGNISEWCQDWVDPIKKENKILRGSSWNVSEKFILRSSYRGHNTPDAFYTNRGFRVVIAGQSPIKNGKLATGNPSEEDCYVLIASMGSDSISALNLGTGEVKVIYKFEEKAGPRGVAVLQSGEIYVGLRFAGMNVIKLTPKEEGGFELENQSGRIGPFGTGKLRITDKGDLLVATDAAGSIYRIDLEAGEAKAKVGHINMTNAVGLDVSGDEVYAVEVFGGRIARFELKEHDALEGWLVSEPDAAMKRSTGIAVGHNENLFVTNTESSFIPEYSRKNGEYLGAFYDVKEVGASTSSDIRYIPALKSYIVSSEGNILRLDTEGKLVRKYSLAPVINGATAFVVVNKKQLAAILAEKL